MKMEEYMCIDFKWVLMMKIFDFVFFMKLIEGIVELIIGELDFNMLEYVKEVGMVVIVNNWIYYVLQWGMVGLLLVISDDVVKKVGKVYDLVIEILVINGVIEGVYVVVMVIINLGDVILVLMLIFLIYMVDVVIVGGMVVEVDIFKINFCLMFELIQFYFDEYGDWVKGLVVVNFINLIGIVMNQDELDVIVDVVCDKLIFVIVDEIYDQFVYMEGVDQYLLIVKFLLE